MRRIWRRLVAEVSTLPLHRSRPPDRIRLLGLLAVKDEMRYLPGWFAANARHLDGVLVHDDGSTDGSREFLAAQPSVLEVVRRDPSAPPGWDEARTRAALYAAAGRHHADWLVAVDADERLEQDFGRRARRAISRLERRGIGAAAIRLPELWGAPDRMRVDGVWAERWRSRLFRWRPRATLDDRPLHGHWAPLDAQVAGGYVPVDLNIYHLRMIRREDRHARRARYLRIDADLAWQGSGYRHLVDETGLRTEPLPSGRAYAPLHTEPELAVVVLAVGNPATLVDAVASLATQDPRPEICVVNSGGGDAAATVARLGVHVVDVAEQLFPGAARNVGIEHTRAPLVAFLSADCIAAPGWVAGRLRAHHAGHQAVASAVVNAYPGSASAFAGQVLAFGRRLPQIDPRHAARYGVSYDRGLLSRVGRFHPDLRTAEDTELHRRLDVPIAWDPTIRTAHRNPTTATTLWRDQHTRGRHTARARADLDGLGPLRATLAQFRGLPADLVIAWQATAGAERRELVRCAPLLAVGATARLLGTVTARSRRQDDASPR